MQMSGQTYRCSAGESFDSIALAVYRDEKYAEDILYANPLLCGKLIFEGGELLSLPVVAVSNTDRDNNYVPATAPWRE